MAINLNDNLLVNAPKATDKRYGPYETEAAAKAALPLAVRFEGLTVGILSGGLKEFWFKDGIADENLVEKIAGAPTSGIPLSTITTKGDIVVGLGNENPGTLPVGNDGEFLVADSSEALGVKWVPTEVKTETFVTDTLAPGESQEFWIDFGNLFDFISVSVTATSEEGWLRAYTSVTGMAADLRIAPGPPFPSSSSGFILEVVTTSSEPSILLVPVPTYYSQSGVVFKFTNQDPTITESFTLEFKYLTTVKTPYSPYCVPAYQYLVPTAPPYSCSTEVNTTGVINFANAWEDCTTITSFPCVDSSTVTDFSYAWSGCSGITSFPSIDTSEGTNFTYSWAYCSNLSSFPPLDFSSGLNFTHSWAYSGLTSFPEIDASNGSIFYGTWAGCYYLATFPELNLSGGTDFTYAWYECYSLTSLPLGLDLSSGTDFYSAWYNCTGLTSFPALDLSSGTDFYYAWYNCTGLTSFPALDLSSGTYFNYAWYNCTGLTSFPALDLSSGTDFNGAWGNCTSLTSLPGGLDLSSGDSFSSAWAGCTGLTSFPGTLDLSSGIFFNNAWDGCSSLTSFPSTLDFSSAYTFLRAWGDCSSLTSFPADVFNSCPGVDFSNAWSNCALDQTSVDNILMSLDSTGLTGGTVGISGGTSSPPGTAGLVAISSLVGKSWTVATN